MTESSAFWMVWNPNGLSPKYKHPNKVSAEIEAERLANLNPNDHFYVLKAECFYKCACVTKTVLVEKRPPF
jgi:hypothetical protein